MNRNDDGDKELLDHLPGDPNKNEINVQGVLLFYTDTGEVLDKNGNVIGELACYFEDFACKNY
jgi:hypothetical protein